jgi:hypothetical protein
MPRSVIGDVFASYELICRIASAAYPSAHCKAKATAEIMALAERGRISVSRSWNTAAHWNGRRRKYRYRSTMSVNQPLASARFQTLPFLHFMHPDALLAAVCREIDSEADNPSALDHSECEKREPK